MTLANLFQQLRGACSLSSRRNAWNLSRFASIDVLKVELVAGLHEVVQGGAVRCQRLRLLRELGFVKELGDDCGH